MLVFDVLLDEGSRSVFADVKSTVILDCELNAAADDIRWEYNTDFDRPYRPISRFNSTGRYSIDVTSGSSSLRIDRIQLQDSGHYRCYTESTNIRQSYYVNVVGTSTIFI